MNNKKLTCILICAAAAVLAVVGWFVLPDTLVMQITASGTAGTKLPKALGLAIPLLMSSVFAVLYTRDQRSGGNNLFISLLGLVLFGVTFLMNLT